MGVGTRWWRRVESEEDNDAWGGPDDVTVAPDPRTSTEDDRREAVHVFDRVRSGAWTARELRAAFSRSLEGGRAARLVVGVLRGVPL